jgi:hypothetical protein
VRWRPDGVVDDEASCVTRRVVANAWEVAVSAREVVDGAPAGLMWTGVTQGYSRVQ